MGVLLSIPQRLLNTLLPFTNPNTPLLQDLIHTAVLCATLYYAPQLVERLNAQQQPHRDPSIPAADNTHDGTANDGSNEDLPLERDLVLQPDDDEVAEPLPPAPTPPPGVPGPADWDAPAQLPEPGDQAPAWEGNAHAGPAAGQNERPRPTAANRIVGAKKAKSLARRDERRAYHEFFRQEAELRRMREDEGREEREAALAAEKARRAEVEREIQERERAERERKKEEERRGHEEERMRRERVVDEVREKLMKRGSINLVDIAWREGKDQLWIERLVRASGLLSKREDGSHTMITGEGWIIKVDAQLMDEAYAAAAQFGDTNEGRISFQDFGGILEKIITARTQA
ncbi:hypothetical protein BU24DRAFT_47664 [Aaosphaeria arxii CBS 175.79]|uniref:Uncharacterized protein n=1 Tax=Aaosphaeria arxii CBS 175.79 TaxID=1450172 RepID=A0A6A5XDH5_9PLEO|nr:uncharacterized protein BU24DRAFT_47664 [Aaosphaeria arxii CBS 175.79]KAF2010857.1 hypothetical protein BU24DRAFT_47664 [Aaosphaeria arxii CBS 175.79]